MYERTLRLSVREGFIWSIMWGLGDAYIAPFAIFLKAGPTTMALLGTLPGLIGSAGQIIGATLMERMGRRRPLLVATTSIQALSFVPIYLLPLLFPASGANAVLVVYCISTLLFSGGGPIWTSLMGDVVPENQRGRFFGMRNRIVLAGMVTFMLLAGFLMSRFTAAGRTLLGFGVLFGISTAARLVCAWLQHLHADPPPASRAPSSLHAPGWWQRLRGSPYAYFVLVQTLLGGAFALAAPFFGLYMLRDLQWSYIQFTTMIVVFLLAQISVLHWWGRICDRHGNRVVYQATCLLLPLPHLLWFLTTDFRLLLAVQVLSGAVSAGANLAASNYMFDSVAPLHRARVISYQSVIMSLVNLGAGLLGAALARHLPHDLHLAGRHLAAASNLPLIFLLAGLLRLLLSFFLLPRLREVRPIEPVSSLEILRRFATAEPWLGEPGPWFARLSPRRGNNSRRPGPPGGNRDGA